ncbi:glycosyltransferase family 2 protein [Halomonas sp. DQ26W]|uniref:glycosyltransferase family 2 protein n=1 Tax=Halomonas sp. DQ26W TaxID=2282311 RepID=UPI000DF7A2EB|nr:glycosyltransferase family 2 protein [Halomonas sp. DQ26W]RDB44274.1 glycosyltransferase family 2 protein [Halomonas sp. DQ26W]
MSKPLVSVYMSVRNGGPYLGHAVNSVRNQTYQNWELIIVDDGSTDDTLNYLLTLPELDNRILVLPTTGMGRGRALNHAISHAKGSYIANLDADDLSHPQRLEVQLALMQQHELPFLCSAPQYIRDDEAVYWQPVDVRSCEVVDCSHRLLRRNPVNHSSVIMERTLCQAVGGYDERLMSQLDYDLWYRICLAEYPITRSSSVLVAKRFHARQSFERHRRLRYIWNSYLVQRRVIAGLGGGWSDRAYMVLRLCIGLVPPSIRLSRR